MDYRAIVSPVIQDREALEEFSDALGDRAPEIERDVARLNKTPADRELTADLFRAIHNIKGDASLCKFELGALVAHPLETLMARFRAGEIPFSALLAETLLLAVDRLELATEALLNGRALDGLHLPQLVEGLNHLADQPGADLEAGCSALIKAVTGFAPVIADFSPLASRPASPRSDTRKAPVGATADLAFFRSLAQQLERRSPLFKGRTLRILRLAQETNKAAGAPVDSLQLEAAVYMHDVGMMMLPESVWLKVGKITDEEKAVLVAHPEFAFGLLSRMPGWETAAEMVAQHHEMPDGSGYPAGLGHDAICPGAKILAIVDAFEAVMLKHIHRGKNRSVLRAIAEVNACDKQFAPEWITPFNAVIRKTIES